MNDITALMEDLSTGYYWRRIYPAQKQGVLNELIHQTNRLAEKLQETMEYQHMNEDRLQTLIKHMASGLLFVNHKGRIVLTNRKLHRMLNWEESVQHKLYYEVELPEEIVHIIQDTYLTEKESKQQVTIGMGLDSLIVKLYVAPVKDHKEVLTGIVLVFYDITDIKKLEGMRKDFVANVSHELKTPLTSIKGFSETLLEGAMHSEKHLKQFLEIIRQESDRLHRLIEELLDLSDLEQKRFRLEWGVVNLNQLIDDTMMLVQAKADHKQIELRFLDSLKAQIEGDADRIRQILLNLISNALQYTPDQGKVTIYIEQWETKGYRICIEDTGEGIGEEDLPRIFERFYRVDKARHRASGGTGLGLAIVKHLVEAHHGQISVKSEVGKGSTFCVCLYTKKDETFVLLLRKLRGVN
ncbi:two-component system histidine kinase PnpS [Caldalkalibacillus mannanilyticus]|uniref:two-component system histidine kinase PnpS n=1 Tax=Caldalkalibacillus mannanilyticus TaxID=1418 RepID=UPI00131EE9F9|nr:ATP-binding protein [Caldalkalibacillus mannanilyticus]